VNANASANGGIPVSCQNTQYTAEHSNLNQCPCFTTGTGQIFFTESDAANPVCECPAGSTWDQNDQTCKCDVAGMIQDPVTGACSCPTSGDVLVNGVCAPCPVGLEAKNGVCICPPPTNYDPSSHKCLGPGSCPSKCVYGCVPTSSGSPQGPGALGCLPAPEGEPPPNGKPPKPATEE
jgi:hypothetical protein